MLEKIIETTRMLTPQWWSTHITFPADTNVITPDMVREVMIQHQNITHITIPEGVIGIEDYAFAYHQGIVSITFPDSLLLIGQSAFRQCTNLTSVTFPKGLGGMLPNAFTLCTGLTSVTFDPKGILCHIGSRAFAGCSGLTSLILPDSLNSIGAYAFQDCIGLTSITFPHDSEHFYLYNYMAAEDSDHFYLIDFGAFSGCTGLTSVNLPNSLKIVEDHAFENCVNLIHAMLPDNPMYSVHNIFPGCVNLQRVIVPASLADMEPEYWESKDININETEIMTLEQLLLDFEKTHDIDKNMSTSQIQTLCLAQPGLIPLPATRADLSTKIFAGITQLTLENLLTLPIDRSLILPTLAQYPSSAPLQSITQVAIATLPLYKLVHDAAQDIAKWLTWQDIARIQMVKTIRPETAAQIPQQPHQARSACQEDDIDVPTRSAGLILFATRHLQNIKLPTLFSRSS